MSAITAFQLKAGEKKQFEFTYKDADGSLVDLSTATFTLQVKKERGGSITTSVADGDFDKASIASSIVKATVDMAAYGQGRYYMEIHAALLGGEVDISKDIYLDMESAVY